MNDAVVAFQHAVANAELESTRRSPHSVNASSRRSRGWPARRARPMRSWRSTSSLASRRHSPSALRRTDSPSRRRRRQERPRSRAPRRAAAAIHGSGAPYLQRPQPSHRVHGCAPRLAERAGRSFVRTAQSKSVIGPAALTSASSSDHHRTASAPPSSLRWAARPPSARYSSPSPP